MKAPLAAAVALLVLSAGCSGLGPSSSSPTPTATTETPTTTRTTASTETPTTTSTPTATPTATPLPEWSPPKPANRPLDDKTEEGRISEVEFVNTTAAENGDGYSNFALQIRADTRMEEIDPPEHGDVEGEPYFLVEIEGEPIARSDYLLQEDDTLFHVPIRKRALEQFEPGELEITVLLMDKDSQYDDIYGTWTGTVRYNPN